MTKWWSDNWKKVESKNIRGGQGTTFKVVSLADESKAGVVKVLNSQNDSTARARMRSEVQNLRVLSTLGIKVPQIIEDGTEGFADPSSPKLYFVMDFIGGATLDEAIEQRKRLSLEDSIAVTLDLAETIEKAHKVPILHRDIKPKNIIVRDFEQRDLVLVDFGLSFNEKESHQDLTEIHRPVGNRFLTLPESGLGGRDKRLPHSDVTLLVGIFYYCLTGKTPEVLEDHSRLAPHRRAGQMVSDVLAGDSRLHAVEALLDRGFRFRAEERFQSCSDLIDRLRAALTEQQTPVENPGDVAARLTSDITAKDRPTQITRIRNKVSQITAHAVPRLVFAFQNSLGEFTFAGSSVPNHPLPLNADLISTAAFSFKTHTHQFVSNLCFAIGAIGLECQLFRMLTRGNHHQPIIEQWKSVLTINPDFIPQDDVMMPILNAGVNAALHDVHAQVLEASSKQHGAK